MRALLEKQRAAFVDDGRVSAETRIDRLDRALTLVHANQDAIVDAIDEDFAGHSREQALMSDVFSTMEGLKHSIKNVPRWMNADKRKVGLPLSLFGVKVKVEYQPKGVVGVLGTWNFPLYTVFSPLASALAAGNRVMLKCSEVAPATAALIAELVAATFEETEVTCVTGGPEAGAAFSSLPFDHLIFTGSEAIGKRVLRAASENLTPVTLELGGKSPTIIARDADVKEAAIRIMTGKALNVGQACLAPDYVMVPEEHLEDFISHATNWTVQMFAALIGNRDCCSMINEHHYRRVLAYIDEAKAAGADVREINPSNEDFNAQSGTFKIPFTLVVNPSDELKLMQEEIFGPVLVVKAYREVEECIEYINERPRPLALYIFSSDEAVQRYVLDHTVSGGVTINDVMVHASAEDLPFGGVGSSGMGHYHGFDGFKTFSHARAVYKQSKLHPQRLAGMIPPFGKRAQRSLKGMLRK